MRSSNCALFPSYGTYEADWKKIHKLAQENANVCIEGHAPVQPRDWYKNIEKLKQDNPTKQLVLTLRIRNPVSYYKSMYHWGVPHSYDFEKWVPNDLQANTLEWSHNSVLSQRNEPMKILSDEECKGLIEHTKYYTFMYTTEHFDQGLKYLRNLTGLELPRKRITIPRKRWIHTNKSFEFPTDETIYRITRERARSATGNCTISLRRAKGAL